MSRTTARLIARRRTARAITPRRPEAVGYSDLIAARTPQRLLAFLVDGVFLHGAMILLGLIVPVIGSFTLSLLYTALHDLPRGAGRSLGRAAVKQRLLRADGTPLDPLTAVMRNAVRWLLWIAVIPFFFDLAKVLFGDGRTLTDLIFDTRVWEDPEHVRAVNTARDSRRQAEVLLQREAAREHAAEASARHEAEAELDDPHADLRRFEARVTQDAP